MKCPKNKKCPKVNKNTLEYFDWQRKISMLWKMDKKSICKKCNNGVDKK